MQQRWCISCAGACVEEGDAAGVVVTQALYLLSMMSVLYFEITSTCVQDKPKGLLRFRPCVCLLHRFTNLLVQARIKLTG